VLRGKRQAIVIIVLAGIAAAPQAAEAFTNMICGIGGTAASQTIAGITRAASGPTAIVTGITVATATRLGCELIVSRATGATLASLAATASGVLTSGPGTWIAATAAWSAAAPPIGGTIVLGAVIGTAGSVLVIYGVPYLWNAVPEETRTRWTRWLSARWTEITGITAKYGRPLYAGAESSFEATQQWIATLIESVMPRLYAQARDGEENHTLHVFPPFEVEVHTGFDPDQWQPPAPGM